MTERLYYTDSHLTEFDALVASVTSREDGSTGVLLDKTAFYPTGGGQPTDTGALGATRVIECVDLEEAGVLHIIEGAPPEVGSAIHGSVDWHRRLDHIQQHTGQHILSQAFVELFGAPTRSFRMLADDSEIDVELRDPTEEKIERAIARANEVIWGDRPLRVHNLTHDEAARLPLRKDSERDGVLRVVEIEDYDFSPCGGTHARRTGEVGMIAARRWERAKGLTRIAFVAGTRAHADYRRANASAREAAKLFSVGRDEVAASIARLMDENRALQRRARALEEIAVRVEAEELLKAARATASGCRVVARVFNDRDAEAVVLLAQALAAHARSVALLGAHDGRSGRFVFARAADADGDMNRLARAACQRIDGRGGGRDEMAQGGGRCTLEQLVDALDEAARGFGR